MFESSRREVQQALQHLEKVGFLDGSLSPIQHFLLAEEEEFEGN